LAPQNQSRPTRWLPELERQLFEFQRQKPSRLAGSKPQEHAPFATVSSRWSFLEAVLSEVE
jgi:hypothetical protein